VIVIACLLALYIIPDVQRAATFTALYPIWLIALTVITLIASIRIHSPADEVRVTYKLKDCKLVRMPADHTKIIVPTAAIYYVSNSKIITRHPTPDENVSEDLIKIHAYYTVSACPFPKWLRYLFFVTDAPDAYEVQTDEIVIVKAVTK
jgi:hypothetical protein